MQLASCLTQWWTSQGETARGVSDIIIQSSGSYLNYNQERFLLASQRGNVTLSLLWGSRGSGLWPHKTLAAGSFREVGGTVRVSFNMGVTQEKISVHLNICDLEHKFGSSLGVFRDVVTPCFKCSHWLALPVCAWMNIVCGFCIWSSVSIIVCDWVQTEWCCLAR